MGNLQKLLSTPVEVSTQTVEHDGETYMLEGLPDSFILDVELMSANKRRSHAAIWTSQLKDKGITASFEVSDGKNKDFDKVQQVFLIHHFWLVEDGDQPPTLTDIAQLSATQGLLFGKCFAATLKILASGKNSVVDTVALGNSQEGEASTSSSSKGASEPPATTPPTSSE